MRPTPESKQPLASRMDLNTSSSQNLARITIRFGHLAAWAEWNAQFGAEITSDPERRGAIAELASSNRVTK